MPFCAVFGCSNSNKKDSCWNVKFHRFPRNIDLQNNWINACGREDKINLNTATICSVHFEGKYRKKTMQQTLLGYSPKNCRYLTDDAIPTQHLPTASTGKLSATPVSGRKVSTEETCRRRLVEELVYQSSISDISSEDVKISIVSGQDGVNNNIEISQLLDRIKQLEEQNLQLKMENEGFRVQNSVLDRQKKDLEEQLKTIPHVSDRTYIHLEIEKILKPLFSPGQLKYLLNKTKRPKWSKEDIASAISLRSVSPKAYCYLRDKLNYPLPDLSTLRRWAV